MDDRYDEEALRVLERSTRAWTPGEVARSQILRLTEAVRAGHTGASALRALPGYGRLPRRGRPGTGAIRPR